MKVSLPGVLLRAAETCEGVGEKDRGFMLRELLKHLRMVRADPSRIGEFFELYVDQSANSQAAKSN